MWSTCKKAHLLVFAVSNWGFHQFLTSHRGCSVCSVQVVREQEAGEYEEEEGLKEGKSSWRLEEEISRCDDCWGNRWQKKEERITT